jgi:steroid 5-alpha reductase family enzyme
MGPARPLGWILAMTVQTLLAAIVFMALTLSVTMGGAWLVQQRTRNSGWVDTIWTFGVGLVGAIAAVTPISGTFVPSARQWVVATLVLAWSLRLGAHIARRTWHITDDPRYARLAKQWGDRARSRMFVFLQNQALGSLPLVLSVWLAAHSPTPIFRGQDIVAVTILAIAVLGEALADHQLREFGADRANRGKLCDVGLWKQSRHPNYFFEWLGWLAYPLLAIDITGSYPWGWLALLAPMFMYWILVHVTGIPPLEEHLLRTRGQAFRDYQARTSIFFPAPRRSPATNPRHGQK